MDKTVQNIYFVFRKYYTGLEQYEGEYNYFYRTLYNYFFITVQWCVSMEKCLVFGIISCHPITWLDVIAFDASPVVSVCICIMALQQVT